MAGSSGDARFLAAREDNKVAYFWDNLVEHLTDLYMREQLERGNDRPVHEHERVVRVMAGETRFSRRLLAKWILERAELAKDSYVGSYFPSFQEGVLYVLLVGPGDRGENHSEYRKARSEQLFARCVAAKAALPERRIIVGIALDARGVKGSSEDFVYVDTDGWTSEAMQAAEKLRQKMGYFVAGKTRHTLFSESEYPDT
ncbi:hypothetical protein [Mesorhizobium sp. M0959]|uniref:hypothetical protein n=1 Tax=unclassified Mesorhizobium TaxID=325217 RepID=UPI00333DF2C4